MSILSTPPPNGQSMPLFSLYFLTYLASSETYIQICIIQYRIWSGRAKNIYCIRTAVKLKEKQA
jgi:hypothetical protein